MFITLTNLLENTIRHAIQSTIQLVGIDNPAGWFVLTIIAYLIFGFGGCVFDQRVWRFRDKSTGQFVKWEVVVFTGTVIDGFIIYLMYGFMGYVDKLSSISSLMICVILTIMLGKRTRR
jgi:hypothetical protein